MDYQIFEKARDLHLKIQETERKIEFFKKSAEELSGSHNLKSMITFSGFASKDETDLYLDLTSEDFEILAKAYQSVLNLLKSEFARL